MFRPVSKNFDVPALERDIIDFWAANEIERKYRERNSNAQERFSFLDGPITANGQMGVHHAWGRTYKDLWQRYNTMLGKKQRYQNGFDCQGLWVEVTVERDLGFTSKRDIEKYGLDEFVRRCKESVFHWASVQTAQSKRLGYFMDWDHSYYTLSDENNYTIWHFLKKCHEAGLIYLGHDVMPWCTRCSTGLSEHEIATEGYQELSHLSVYVRLPVTGRPGEHLLVWTTTPWTLTSNVAVAVNPDLTYVRARLNGETYIVANGALAVLGPGAEVLEEMPGSALVGLEYEGPFDYLPAEREVRHVVIPWDEVSETEGTGLVHIAPGAGKEDFQLGKEHELAVVAPLDQFGNYVEGFDWLSGMNVHEVAEPIVEDLRRRGLLFREHMYSHRYPVCWRCGTQLVFRLVDEWFISMEPLREPMMNVVRKIRWIPGFGLERELDWLRNMSDWMISKKRYWGLALPFWVCPNNHLTVIGGKEELFHRAIGGVRDFESPHRPWIDEITIACDQCGEEATRILDVGNPWLDAGIVPYSTLHYFQDRAYWEKWFPADFITESFPGQFRNWFYSMLAMSTVLEDTNPFSTVLGYALAKDAEGREMHKSWGNLIPFDEAAERSGADMMRWLFAGHNPEANLHFGWEALDEVKRRLLTLWNTYSFFVTYANLDGWTPDQAAPRLGERPEMDRWLIARLHGVIASVRQCLDDYDAQRPVRAIETFIEDLSTWYVRRSRRRFWKAENDADKASAYATLWETLSTLTRLMAPFVPFLSETLYQNLVAGVLPDAPESVHLADYPVADPALVDQRLLTAMRVAQDIVALGRAARDAAGLKVRQPLARMYVTLPGFVDQEAVLALRDVILDEMNVKILELAGSEDEFLSYSVRPNLPVLGPRFGKRVPQLRAALEALDPADVARVVAAGRPVEISLDGEAVALAASDVLVDARQREGYAAMAADGLVVALDTQLTTDLVREGLARDVVRRVNEWRKDAGFNISDRISIRYEASPELSETIQQHQEYIKEQTLATSLSEGLNGTGYSASACFGGQTLTVKLDRPGTTGAA